MKTDSVFWKVVKVPISEVMGEEVTSNSDITHAVYIEHPRTKVKRFVNFCSADYSLIRNTEIRDKFLGAFQKTFKTAEVSVVTKGYSQFALDFIIDSKKPQTIVKGDIIKPTIRVYNSYDGKVKYSLSAGFHRVICDNGLMVMEQQGKLFKGLHTVGLDEGLAIEKALGMAAGLIASSDILTDYYREMTGIRIANGELDAVLDEIIAVTDFPAKLKEMVMNIITNEASILKAPITGWLVYNGFNNLLNHDANIGKSLMQRRKIEEEIMDYIYKAF